MKIVPRISIIVLLAIFAAGCSKHRDANREPSPAGSPEVTAAASPTPVSPPSSSAVSSQAPAGLAPASPAGASSPAAGVSHIVVVVEENHSYNQIVGNPQAPYLQSLIAKGALFTDAHGIAHPSQPNYIALFSGSTQGVKNDSCKGPYEGPNLSTQLRAHGLTFTGYSENLPKPGYTGCSSGGYARKHNPWVQFSSVPAEENLPLTEFPTDFSWLPAVSFVIPVLKNDMHDGSVGEADAWLKTHLAGYEQWAQSHNSLLIVTWDEDDFAKDNHIPLILVGPMVKQGTYSGKINHYHVLRLIEDLFRLEPLGESIKVSAPTDLWK